MANELVHKTQGTSLTQAEYENVDAHICNSQATGDIIYASSATQLRRLGIGSSTQLLITSGGIPAWETAVATATASTVVRRDASARAAFAAPAAAGDALIKGTRLTAAEMLDGTSGYVLTAQGAGVSPAYAAAAGGFTSKARAYKSANQTIQASNFRTVRFESETYDVDAEFNSSVVSGTTTSAAASKLINTGAAFVAGDNGRYVHNTTDNTYAKVTAVDSPTQLSIDTDIMANAEAYKLYFSKFVATTTGYYFANVAITVQSSTSGASYYGYILRSDSAEFARLRYIGNGTALVMLHTDVIYLTAGQSIIYQYYTEEANSVILAAPETGFTIHRLS